MIKVSSGSNISPDQTKRIIVKKLLAGMPSELLVHGRQINSGVMLYFMYRWTKFGNNGADRRLCYNPGFVAFIGL